MLRKHSEASRHSNASSTSTMSELPLPRPSWDVQREQQNGAANQNQGWKRTDDATDTSPEEEAFPLWMSETPVPGSQWRPGANPTFANPDPSASIASAPMAAFFSEPLESFSEPLESSTFQPASSSPILGDPFASMASADPWGSSPEGNPFVGSGGLFGLALGDAGGAFSSGLPMPPPTVPPQPEQIGGNGQKPAAEISRLRHIWQ